MELKIQPLASFSKFHFFIINTSYSRKNYLFLFTKTSNEFMINFEILCIIETYQVSGQARNQFSIRTFLFCLSFNIGWRNLTLMVIYLQVSSRRSTIYCKSCLWKRWTLWHFTVLGKYQQAGQKVKYVDGQDL